jgi:hypothetical protein
MRLGRTSEIRVGFEIARAWNSSRIGVVSLVGGVEKQVRMSLVHDGQDRAYFPTRGFRMKTRATRWSEAPGASRPFSQIEGTAGLAGRLGAAHHVSLHLEGVAGFGGPAPLLYQPGVGGPFHLGSLPFKAFRGRHAVVAGVGYRVAIARLPRLLGDSLYITGLLETGSAFDRASDARFRTGATFGLAADTFLGPFFAGASFDKSGGRAYFLIGASIR